MFVSTNSVTPADLTDRILELIGACGRDKNDRAIAAITLCISEGIDTRNHIVASVARAGFKGGHVAAILDDCEGAFAESHHWRLGADGRYRLHAESKCARDAFDEA
jgi:hypothetical protein